MQDQRKKTFKDKRDKRHFIHKFRPKNNVLFPISSPICHRVGRSATIFSLCFFFFFFFLSQITVGESLSFLMEF